MPVPSDLERDPAIARPLGGLLLSAVRAESPMLVVRAVRWWRNLDRLGVHVPLFVAHDIGLLYGVPRDQIEVRPRPGCDAALASVPGMTETLRVYRELIADIAAGRAAWGARAPKLTDDLVVVILARVLSGSFVGENTPAPEGLPFDPELVRDLDPQLPRLYAAVARGAEARALGLLAGARLRMLTLVDALDVDTLRLLGMLASEGGAAAGLAHVDLLAALASPSANDIVGFSLELLPRILETHSTRGTGTLAMSGYKGVGRRGSLDSLVPSELAWDELELARRLVDGELLYYSREQTPEPARRLHHVVIDASASMRGEREVFARGLAIALGKKLELEGEDVFVRFFDSRLYDVHRLGDKTPKLPAAWLLGFKGERGRNPARVFAQLATELGLLQKRERREAVVHLITHAALHVPRPLVAEVCSQAHVFGVFILPSGGKLELEWVDLLDGHAIVDYATLKQKGARAVAAHQIVDLATQR
ncbi:MAG TPA: hypothetical protein VKU41_04565 [Polyangiaceae bacterium]|nr:hypothetical protein [Polyangiaceae bacterium]